MPWNKGKIGLVPWNKGKTGIYSPGTLKRMSDANKGNHNSLNTEFKKGHKFHIEVERKRIESVRKSLTLVPNLVVDENLAYLLGVLKGDGYVTINKHTNAHIIGLQNTSMKLINNFLKSLQKLGLNPYIHKASRSRKSFQKRDQYRAIAYSRIFHEWYSNLSIEKLKDLLDTKEKMSAFVKGFYEAEGSISKTRTGRSLSIINTKPDLLNLVDYLLQNLNIQFHFNGPYPPKLGKRNYYRLCTSKRQEIENFIKIINPDIKRREKNGV